jgi:hypothetical protein
MEKRIRSIEFGDRCLQLKEVLFRCAEKGVVVTDTQVKEQQVWIFDISVEEKDFFFKNQRNALIELKGNPQVIRLHGEVQVDMHTMALVTESVERDPLSRLDSSNQFIDHQILGLGIGLAALVDQIHRNHKVANCLNPEFIFRGQNSLYKCVNFTGCFDQENLVVTNSPVLALSWFNPESLQRKNPYEHCLQQHEDIFAFGLLLHQICFNTAQLKRDPANPDKILFPASPKYNYSILSVIEQSTCQNIDKRISLKAIIQTFENEKKLGFNSSAIDEDSSMIANITFSELSGNFSEDLEKQKLSPGLFASLSTKFTIWTTETEGWFLSYVAPDLSAPDNEFVKKILIKAWKNRDKIKKIFEIIEKFLANTNNTRNPIIALKLLLFLHQLIMMGPREIISFEKHSKKPKNEKKEGEAESPTVMLGLLLKIHGIWTDIINEEAKEKHEHLKGRGLNSVVLVYSLLLIEKAKIAYFYRNSFTGNFSISPMLRSQDIKPIFSMEAYKQLFSYCSDQLNFFSKISEKLIGPGILFQFVQLIANELQNLFGLLTHMISTFLKVAWASDPTQQDQLEDLRRSLLTNYENCVIRFSFFLNRLTEIPSFRLYVDLLPVPNTSSISELRSLARAEAWADSFTLETFMNTFDRIGLFCIPTPYGDEGQNVKGPSPKEHMLTIKREVEKMLKHHGLDTQELKSHDQQNQKTISPLSIESRPTQLMSIHNQTKKEQQGDVKGYFRLEDNAENRPAIQAFDDIEEKDFESELGQDEISIEDLKIQNNNVDSTKNVEPLVKYYNPFEEDPEAPFLSNKERSLEKRKVTMIDKSVGTTQDNLFLSLLLKEDKTTQWDESHYKEASNDMSSSIIRKSLGQSDSFDLVSFMKDEISQGMFGVTTDIGDWVIKLSELTFIKKIAGGSTCEVHQGEYRGLVVGNQEISLSNKAIKN